MKNQNNTDFQTDIQKNMQTDLSLSQDNATQSLEEQPIDCIANSCDNADCKTIDSNNADTKQNEVSSSTITPLVEAEVVENNDSKQYNNNPSDNVELSNDEPSTQEVENKNCSLDKAKFDKLKNWFFGSIPFILVAIVISLFNIGRVRQPLSFLFLSLGLAELAITNFVISKKIANTCSCKSCIHQSKSSFKYAILFGVAAIGLLGLFIFYLVKQ